MSLIKAITAREILDSRGNPTIEVDVRLADGTLGRAAVPSGASTGSREAHELRDGDPTRFGGKGVRQAIAHVEQTIVPALREMPASDQTAIDEALIRLDGSANKSRLGANAILGVSMAIARAAASSGHRPLYRSFGDETARTLPLPMFNVLNGGVHADNSVDFQEFMIAPVGAPSFSEAVRMGAEVYQALRALLKTRAHGTGVGDEGGFAPNLVANVEAVEVILEAITQAGLRPGLDVVLALDPAASEFRDGNAYVLRKSDGSVKTSVEMVDLWESWVRQFPIASIEDGLAEDDWDGWELLTRRLGDRVQIVGDDLIVTNPEIIRDAIRKHACNAALIKLNQIGTVTETIAAMREARSAGWTTVISHRSGETSDDFIADFAVGTSADQIKSGAPCRGERVAKYNQLMRIEQELGAEARFAGGRAFAPRPATGGS